ncbi:MAG: hypothetical protein CL532_01665 [Aestuariivita sp.]|nr:hypothetical protein [Aestuariivita sp.]|tara:strand:- start:6214 stop:6639 length:426 start_codon:yes stop_codon:yes gene_type:complete
MGASVNKASGTVFEYIFAVAAMQRGLHPFMPLETHLPQDYVVMNDAGKSFRVQVKGTQHVTQTSPTARKRYKIMSSTGASTKNPIDCAKVDIVPSYIATEDIWYIIPCLELQNSKTFWLYNHPESKGRLEKWKERWDLFRQ